MSLEPLFRPNNKWDLDPIWAQESESKWTVVPIRPFVSVPHALVLVEAVLIHLIGLPFVTISLFCGGQR